MNCKNATVRKNVSEGIGTNKTIASKECMLCHYCYFILDLNSNYMFVINVKMYSYCL